MENHVKRSGTGTAVLLTTAACFVYMVTCGIRNNFGLMLTAITEHAGLAFASVSFVLAVGQFCFGVTQPLSGLLADRRGNRFALVTGLVCAAAGTVLLPLCRSQGSLMLVLGILLPGGLGLTSFGLLLDSVTPRIPASLRTLASGVLNASSGMGNTLMTPVVSGAILAGGLTMGAGTLAILAAIAIPVTWFLCGRNDKKRTPKGGKEENLSVGELTREAVHSRDYLFIVFGFFTCGFHMALITNHLATEIMSYGYSYQEAANAFSIYGVATILGALAVGAVCGRLSMKNVLGTLYASRTLWIVLFFLLPKTMPVICGYIILLGATGSSTVTPVSELCRSLFGQRGVTIFFGVAFVAHQIGSFFSAWLGGVCFESTGGYTAIWAVDAVLSLAAALVSYKLRVRKQ